MAYFFIGVPTSITNWAIVCNACAVASGDANLISSSYQHGGKTYRLSEFDTNDGLLSTSNLYDALNTSSRASYVTTAGSGLVNTNLSYTQFEYTQYKVCTFLTETVMQGAYSGNPLYLYSSPIYGDYETWTSGYSNWDRKYQVHKSSFVAGKDSVNIGFTSSSYGTRIIQLSYTGGNYNRGIGVINNNTTLPTSGTFETQADSKLISDSSTGIDTFYFKDDASGHGYVGTTSSERTTYFIHNTNSAAIYGLNFRAVVFGTGTSGTEYGQYYYTSQTAFDSWCSRTGWIDNKNHYAITVKTNNLCTNTYTSISLTAGYEYKFRFHTFSENNYDGIILSQSTFSQFTGTLSNYKSQYSYVLDYCTGNDNKKTYTYTPTSNQTVYLYFRTDSSELGPDSEGYCYGDVEVTRQVSTVTLNRNGGSGGSSTVTATTGSNLPSITVPTRTGFTFLGYFDDNSNYGHMYISSSGTGCRIWDDSVSTLYAYWRPIMTYDSLYDSTVSVYCSNRDKETSTTDSTKIIQVSQNGGQCQVAGIPTYYSLRVEDTNYHPYYNWDISSDGKKLIVPKGTSANTYNVIIEFYCNDGSNYCEHYEILYLTVYMLSTTMSSISVTADTSTMRFGDTQNIYVYARYPSSLGVDIAERQGVEFSMSPLDIVDYYQTDIYLYPKGLKMYVDDFSDDWNDFDIQNWILNYHGHDMYFYTSETMNYDGGTYYLWKCVSDTSGHYVKYLLTDTIDLNVLYAHSLKYSLNNIHTYPIIVKLDSDLEEYDSGFGYNIVDVWDDNNPDWDFYYETGIGDEGWQEPYEPYEPYEPPYQYDPADDPDEPWDY